MSPKLEPWEKPWINDFRGTNRSRPNPVDRGLEPAPARAPASRPPVPDRSDGSGALPASPGRPDAPPPRANGSPLHGIAKTLLPLEAATYPYKIHHFGPELSRNKQLLNRAFDARGIPKERRALMTVMAMIETDHLAPRERDWEKDSYPDGSANASIFNLNEHLLRELGYRGNIHQLDPLDALPETVGLINKGFDTWGVAKTLNFVRGGQDSVNDPTKWDAPNYRRAVATGLRLIEESPALLVDDRRIVMDVKYVDHLKSPPGQ